jgi:hypothetical protein
LIALAKGYQSKAVLRLVEAHRQGSLDFVTPNRSKE